MKMIHLIFIVACLIEQLKADVFSVEVIDIIPRNTYLATIEDDPDFIVTFNLDIDEKEIYLQVTFIDPYGSTFFDYCYPDIANPCYMTDHSYKKSTVSAIFWGIFGIDSCPVKAGVYPAVNYSQTGQLDDTFEMVGEEITMVYEPGPHQIYDIEC